MVEKRKEVLAGRCVIVSVEEKIANLVNRRVDLMEKLAIQQAKVEQNKRKVSATRTKIDDIDQQIAELVD